MMHHGVGVWEAPSDSWRLLPPKHSHQLSEKNCSITIENPTNTSKFRPKSSSFDKVKRNKQSPKLTLEKYANFAEWNSIEFGCATWDEDNPHFA